MHATWQVPHPELFGRLAACARALAPRMDPHALTMAAHGLVRGGVTDGDVHAALIAACAGQLHALAGGDMLCMARALAALPAGSGGAGAAPQLLCGLAQRASDAAQQLPFGGNSSAEGLPGSSTTTSSEASTLAVLPQLVAALGRAAKRHGAVAEVAPLLARARQVAALLQPRGIGGGAAGDAALDEGGAPVVQAHSG